MISRFSFLIQRGSYMDTLSERASALSDKETDYKWIQIIEEWQKLVNQLQSGSEIK